MSDERAGHTLATDFFIVPDGRGNMRRIYRVGCVRCGKETKPGREFCEGHAYMEGSQEAALRKSLTKKSPIESIVRWLKK